jgi:hypothetical protein
MTSVARLWERLRGKINPLTTLLKAADPAASIFAATNEVDA